jgi:hypothetical protein
MRMGFLTDRHLPEEERNSWKGDRARVGGDFSLAISALAASYPLFRYSSANKDKAQGWNVEKNVRIGFWGEIVYRIRLNPPKKGRDISPEQNYVRRCYHFGRKRFKMLQTAKQMIRHIELVTGHREHTLKEIW